MCSLLICIVACNFCIIIINNLKINIKKPCNDAWDFGSHSYLTFWSFSLSLFLFFLFFGLYHLLRDGFSPIKLTVINSTTGKYTAQ